MLKKFSEKYFCGLDIGSQSVKAGVIKAKAGQSSELLGIYETKTAGFKRASVTDLGELSECIQTVLAELSKRTSVKIKEIQVGIGGELIEHGYSTAIIPLSDRGNKVITRQDIKEVQDQARLLGVNIEEMILHDFPQYYKVDDVNSALNPLGLYGRKLEIKTLLISVTNIFTKNIIKAVNQAGYDLGQIFFTAVAAAQASLGEFHLRQGCVLGDVGSYVTDLLIFKDGCLKQLDRIPIGGEHFTQQIVQDLVLPFDLADDLKKSYAFAMHSEVDDQEEILIKREDRYLPIKKHVICQSIEPIVTKFIESIFNILKTSRFHEQMNAGILLVGGGALLPGLPERIEQSTHLTVKMGKIDLLAPKLHHVAKYASCIGLGQLAFNKTMSPALSNPSGGFARRWVNRVKDLYQEYF